MLTEEIQTAVKEKKAVLGFRESLQEIKTRPSKMVVMANNLPEEMKTELEAAVAAGKSAKTPLASFAGSSRDLGVVCGKPFPVAVLVIRS